APILTAGLLSVVSDIKEFSLEPVKVRPADLFRTAQRLKPAAIIADLSDSTVLSELNHIKTDLSGNSALIGLYHSALPPATMTSVDATLSIYDGASALINALKQTVVLPAKLGPNDLTPREKEIIQRVVKGLSNKEIAAEINLSVNTVMTHRRNIASKLRIHSPAGLTIFAIASKLVSLDEISNIPTR
ncbi:MAG: LuxR C-terminal-related transcriptional regulator, partial [Muribaculaceae bacterium]|nr:LuxR C-terminal-related transcriptional regulator [Muribaculaceae bacterium]